MPTGTGKTETMLALLVSARCHKLFVVVPTDALRSQLASKFLSLGILKAPGGTLLKNEAMWPIVCALEHIPKDIEDVDAVLEAGQVIVTTSSIAGQCSRAVQERIAQKCPYLFIDEAHHAEAPTWRTFKSRFKGSRIVQFTATPFREDGQLIDGDIVFRYPLKKAQAEGYFQPIRFEPVVEFNPRRSDEAIVERAVAQLRADFEKGHVLMARVDKVERARRVFDLYAKYPEFNPVQLHTGMTQRQRTEARGKILAGRCRVIVCVDMLGEGFDLPQLKIAAFHDIRKSLAVTLQLVGRFTRALPGLGDATVVANTADVQVQDELRKLYTRDPDWNVLLPQLADSMVGEQVSLQEFLRGFTAFDDVLPLKAVKPATSVVVYRTTCNDWRPEQFLEGIPSRASCHQIHHAVNQLRHTLVVVTARRGKVPWSDDSSLFGWEWELYVVVWRPEQHLLFINCSANAGEYRQLAEAVAGDAVSLINGQTVFRSFAGVNRLRLQNVGLTEQLGRNIRYTGRMGTDVESGLSDVQRRKAKKSVLSGSGYEDGTRVTVGASKRGRIWSHQRARVDQLVDWCQAIGSKLLDEAIDPDEVLRGTLNAKVVDARPPLMPIGVGWPEEVFLEAETQWTVTLGEADLSMAEVGIELVDPKESGALRFAVTSEEVRAEFELELFRNDDESNFLFKQTAGPTTEIGRGGVRQDGAGFFTSYPPTFWFVNGSSLEGNELVELRIQGAVFDAGRIQEWDWAGVNLRKESQGEDRVQDSVQARVIEELKRGEYRVIVDDDRKGEAADVVAVRVVEENGQVARLEVELYHCKYSSADLPGGRVADLYEVCGQAQTSIFWLYSTAKTTDLFTHLLRRNALRESAGKRSRLELGTSEDLLSLREMSRVCPIAMKVCVVQPGLSKRQVSREQLELLGVTDNYLRETFQVPLEVIGSS
jgi:hypothetical protein